MNRDNIKEKIIVMEIVITPGCRYFPEFLNETSQRELLDHIQKALCEAPLFHPTMPRTGKPFSVRMSNMGEIGWVSDKKGRLSLSSRSSANQKKMAANA